MYYKTIFIAVRFFGHTFW